MPGTPCGQSHENTCNAKLKVDDSSLSSYPYESGFFPILISFHPAPEADPQVGHRANTVHFARYFFRFPLVLPSSQGNRKGPPSPTQPPLPLPYYDVAVQAASSLWRFQPLIFGRTVPLSNALSTASSQPAVWVTNLVTAAS